MEIGKFKVITQLREGAMIGYPPGVSPNVKEGDFVIVILDDLARKSSIGIDIASVGNYPELKEPTIIIDSRVAGEITNDDVVRAITTNAPLANYVEVLIPSTSGIYEGDWSETIRPQLMEKVCDIGAPLRFSTPTKDGQSDAVNLSEGTINRTIPSPPVKIGPSTTIRVLKRSLETINNLKLHSLEEKTKRAESFLEELERKVFEILRELKSGKLEPYSRSYEFKTRPEDFYESLKQVLESSYEYYDEQIYERKTDEDLGGEPNDTPLEKIFSGTMSFFTRTEGKPDKIIEAQINGKDDKTNLILTVYSKNKVDAMYFLEEQLHDKVFTISKGIAIQAEVVAEKCSCGTLFDITKADPEGWIKCPSCDTISQLPVKYRNIKIGKR